MPINRIINQFDLSKSDNVILVYGQVNDTFATSDLALFRGDGIEKILSRYLLDNGYRQIVFYSPERQLYVYDEQSFYLCFPPLPARASEGDTTSGSVSQGNDGRPLGAKKLLQRRRADSGRSVTLEAGDPDAMYRPVWHPEGFISVVRSGSDSAVLDIIRATLSTKKFPTAVIFSQFDSTSSISEIQRRILPMIGRMLRADTDNKCIFITNAVNMEKLREVIENVPALGQIVTMGNEEKGLDSLVYVDFPFKDEIRNLIHRQRIKLGKKVDWLQLDNIVRGLDMERNQLKKWDRDFRSVEQFDVPNINKILSNGYKINEKDFSAWKKLEALVGLQKIKSELRLYFQGIRESRENNTGEQPLMHIVLKGNPGTGKTTLARIIAEIFREEGLLDRGHLIEVDRERLVAGYIGQTAPKTDACCREALGGVLFIDEAYSLAVKESAGNNNGNQDFGQEAIDTLIKRMSDWQDRFCVILAGYPEDMERLLNTNSGFGGRIGLHLHIEDYLPGELLELLKLRLVKAGKSFTPEFERAIRNVFTNVYNKRSKKFDNARFIEQDFGRITRAHLERCEQLGSSSREIPIDIHDIPQEYRKKGWAEDVPANGSAMVRLNSLIGLNKAKKQIKQQVALVQSGKAMPGYDSGRRLHLIFKGKPGTGKTTVARLLGEIYQDNQILPNNVFVEVTRKDLIAEYSGQTAPKVEQKCKEAMGGILFIDEVYTLVNGDNDTFGKEAVDTLITIMENERERFCVVVAGYPDKMRDFLDANPGLRRRFGGEIEFEDYNADDLLVIFKYIIEKKELVVSEGVLEKVAAILKEVYARKDENFGNAGEVENMVQLIQQEHSYRCFMESLSIATEPIREMDLPASLLELLPVLNSDEVIQEAISELEGLVGLSKVKKLIQDLITEYRHEREALRRNPELPRTKRNYHLIFEGNPGTGKTVVARIMGKILKALDVLKKGNVMETQRNDFVAGFQGQTAEKTRKLIRSALDNVLFIDEAYALNQGMMDSFGVEAIDTLLKMMEDYRDRLVVIATGYPRNMRNFLSTNPGLSGRFPRRILFEDYTIEQLAEIFAYQVRKRGYRMDLELEKEVVRQMTILKGKKKQDFGNAREVENFLDSEVLPNYRRRTIGLDHEGDAFWTITKEDFPDSVIGDADTPLPPAKSDFSPKKEEEERKQQAASMLHTGSGDIVAGNKIINDIKYIRDEDRPKNLTLVPKVCGSKVIGRDTEIEKVFDRLMSKQTSGRIALFGVGGIGKTRLLIQFIENYQDGFDHIVWLDYTVSLQKTFIENSQLYKNLQVTFREQEDEKSRYESLIEALDKLNKSCLLVIDNMPVSDHETLQTLQLPSKIKILVSSREALPESSNFISIPLSNLDKSAAIDLFKMHYREDFDAELIEQLLEPLSYHPLAVEVIAKILAQNKRKGLAEMARTIQEKGLHVRQGKIEMAYKLDYNADQEVIEIFKSILNIKELPKEEMELIRYFSVLPANPISLSRLSELFEKLMEDKWEEKLGDLTAKGLLVFDNERGYYCHQLIQQVCREELAPSAENIEPLFINLGIKLGMKIDEAVANKGLFPLISKYLNTLEYFISHFESGIDLVKYRVLINLSVLYRVNGQFDKSVEISQKELKKLEEHKNEQPVLYNIINRNIAFALLQGGNHFEAEKYYRQGVDHLESIKDRQNHEHREFIEKEIILSYSQLGISYLRPEVNDTQTALEFFDRGFEIAQKANNVDPLAIASLREGMALAQIEGGDFSNAMTNLKEAKRIMVEDIGMDKSSLPIGLIDISLALTYAGQSDFGAAEVFCNDGIEILKAHLPADSIEFCRAYTVSSVIKMSMVSSKLNDLGDLEYLEDQDIEMLEKASVILKKSIDTLVVYRGEHHKDLAVLYSTLGLIYKWCNNEDLGYQYHMKGVQLYEQDTHKNVLIAGMYFRTVLYFENMLSYEQGKKYLDKCIESIPENLPDYQLGVSFFNYCIGQYARQNGQELRDAIVYTEKALNGIREYENKDKNDLASDSPLEVLCLQEIATIHGELGEYSNALKRQLEAVEICDRHSDDMGEEIAGPYANLASIYKKNADESGDYKMEASALEYKLKAQNINREMVLNIRDLQTCGQLHSVRSKDKEGKDLFSLMILSDEQMQHLREVRNSDPALDIRTYGHVLYSSNSYSQIQEKIGYFTEKYGNLNEELRTLN